MKGICVLVFFVALTHSGYAQSKLSPKQEIKAYQADQNKKFKDERISPLNPNDLVGFDGLKFYRPKKAYRITTQFVRTPGSEPFEMPTTTDRKPMYEKYGEVHFTIKGQKLKLNVYQSHEGRRNPLYRSNLFLPFKDLTNSKRTYGGGRFLDLKIPKGETMVIDFNKAYNPYCAYSEKYSCPIVPVENNLGIAIKAGVKKYK